MTNNTDFTQEINQSDLLPYQLSERVLEHRTNIAHYFKAIDFTKISTSDIKSIRVMQFDEHRNHDDLRVVDIQLELVDYNSTFRYEDSYSHEYTMTHSFGEFEEDALFQKSLIRLTGKTSIDHEIAYKEFKSIVETQGIDPMWAYGALELKKEIKSSQNTTRLATNKNKPLCFIAMRTTDHNTSEIIARLGEVIFKVNDKHTQKFTDLQNDMNSLVSIHRTRDIIDYQDALAITVGK